jgi:hypothetical protein
MYFWVAIVLQFGYDCEFAKAVILSEAKDLQGGTHKQILRFAQDDSFEIANVLSPGNFYADRA